MKRQQSKRRKCNNEGVYEEKTWEDNGNMGDKETRGRKGTRTENKRGKTQDYRRDRECRSERKIMKRKAKERKKTNCGYGKQGRRDGVKRQGNREEG